MVMWWGKPGNWEMSPGALKSGLTLRTASWNDSAEYGPEAAHNLCLSVDSSKRAATWSLAVKGERERESGRGEIRLVVVVVESFAERTQLDICIIERLNSPVSSTSTNQEGLAKSGSGNPGFSSAKAKKPEAVGLNPGAALKRWPMVRSGITTPHEMKAINKKREWKNSVKARRDIKLRFPHPGFPLQALGNLLTFSFSTKLQINFSRRLSKRRMPVFLSVVLEIAEPVHKLRRTRCCRQPCKKLVRLEWRRQL